MTINSTYFAVRLITASAIGGLAGAAPTTDAAAANADQTNVQKPAAPILRPAIPNETVKAVEEKLTASVTAAPSAGLVEMCINDFRIQTSHERHSLSGFGKMKDGRQIAFSVSARDMAVIQGRADGSIVPIVAAPGTGYISGAEPELVRFLERAAKDSAWVRLNLDAPASGSTVQKVVFAARSFNASYTGPCYE